MQCPNCHFENMPGSAACVRCGSAVAFSAVSVAVQPPRAAPWRKRSRRWLPWRRPWYAVRDGAIEIENWLGRQTNEPLLVSFWTPALAMRSFFPGWVHWRLGHRGRGAVFALLFWPMTIIGLLTLGSPVGGFLIGLALWAQWGSLIDLWTQPDDRWRDRLVYVPIKTLLLLAAVYVPLAWAASRIAVVRRLEVAAANNQAGDVLLFRTGWRPWTNVAPGDLVLYSFDRQLVELGSHRYLNLYGERLDRVIAGPGSSVEWNAGRLRVDGRDVAWLPLDRWRLPKVLMVRVPVDHYCIFPTNNVGIEATSAPELWQELSLVPFSNIRGRLVVRTYPLSRWSWIE